MSAPDRVTDPYRDPVPVQGNGEALFGVPPAPPATDLVAPPVENGGRPGIDYHAIERSPDFTELRRRTLRYTVPMTLLFLGNYMLFVLLSAYAPGLMGTPAIGLINIGFLVGVFQFFTTVAIVMAYGRFAQQRTDPLVERIRDRVEGP